MPKTDVEQAGKWIHKMTQAGMVKPGAYRVIIDIDAISGQHIVHSFGKTEGAAAKSIIDKVYTLFVKHAPPSAPKSAPKPPERGNNKKA